MQQEIYESVLADMARNLNRWETLSEAAEKTGNMALKLESSYFTKSVTTLRKLMREFAREEIM